MRFFLGFFVLFGLWALQAYAIENVSKSAAPPCFRLINKTHETVYGMIRMAPGPDGAPPRQANFTLPEGKVFRVCTEGPFFPDGRINLVLRTLMPIFDCKTLPQGDVEITRIPKPDDPTITTLTATCH